MDLIMILKNGEYVKIVLDDREDRPIGKGFDCYMCEHSTNHRVCKAFKKIPDDIWYGKHDHKTPYPGDNSISFTPIEKKQKV